MQRPEFRDRKTSEASTVESGYLIPAHLTAGVAIFCAFVLVLLAALGPLGLGVIHYKSSQSAIWQLEGQDLADLFVIAPALAIGGALILANRVRSAKYFLILTPVTLMYTGLSIGIGQEWSDPAYSGNVQNYFGIFLSMMIGGLILLVGTLSMFSERDAPNFKQRNLRIYVGVMGVFLSVFAAMWVSQILQIINTGDLADHTYSAAPTVFWTIRYLDLGISVPVGFLALSLLLSKPRKAFPIILLFFGFFITMASVVNADVAVSIVHNDPSVASMGASVAIFPILGVLAVSGLLYLVKDKLPKIRALS